MQAFALNAQLEGMRLLEAFEALRVKWRGSGASITRMATIHELAMQRPLPARAVVMGELAGRSGLLAAEGVCPMHAPRAPGPWAGPAPRRPADPGRAGPPDARADGGGPTRCRGFT